MSLARRWRPGRGPARPSPASPSLIRRTASATTVSHVGAAQRAVGERDVRGGRGGRRCGRERRRRGGDRADADRGHPGGAAAAADDHLGDDEHAVARLVGEREGAEADQPGAGQRRPRRGPPRVRVVLGPPRPGVGEPVGARRAADRGDAPADQAVAAAYPRGGVGVVGQQRQQRPGVVDPDGAHDQRRGLRRSRAWPRDGSRHGASAYGRGRARPTRTPAVPRLRAVTRAQPGQAARRRRRDVRRRGPALRPDQRRAVAGPGPPLAHGWSSTRSTRSPGERVLDLAAGTGTSSQPFADRGATVVPCDFSLGMLRVGKQARPHLRLHRRRRHPAAVRRRHLRRGDDLLRAAQHRRPRRRAARDAAGDQARRAARGLRVQPPDVGAVPDGLRRVPDEGAARRSPARCPRARTPTSTSPSRSGPGPTRQRLAERIAQAGWSAPRWRNLSGGIVALHRAVADLGLTGGIPGTAGSRNAQVRACATCREQVGGQGRATCDTAL